MTIRDIVDKIEGRVLSCEDKLSTEIEYAFSSDLMSDVLTVRKENILLITGLANIQAIRISEMSDINCIVFGRDKKLSEDIISLARENEMVVIESPFSVFRISGELFKAGIKPIF